MTWISFICLLALTSSAFGQYSYGGSNTAVPSAPTLTRQILPKTVLPTASYGSQSYGQVLPSPSFDKLMPKTQTVDSYSYQQPAQVLPQQPLVPQVSVPKTLPDQSYGSVSQGGYGSPLMVPQSDTPVVAPVLTEADIICKDHNAEDIIPLGNHHKFIVCLAKGKGVEQECPGGLVFHPTSLRCERNLGPLEDMCVNHPCLNGGQCLTVGSSFQCQCVEGFEGIHCELDARICKTQMPCGSAPDTKCQSFRAGAALPYICIFQNGLAYGLTSQQIIGSPCRNIDGPHALAVSKNGFIMCDVDRMFIESCPGGTVWDDIEKACSWPDQQTFLEDAPVPTSSYGSQVIIPQQPVQSYGNQVIIPQQPVQSYGNQVIIPQQPVQSYGSKMIIPQQPIKLHENKMIIPQQQPVQSYGNQVIIPQQPVQSYGSQVHIPRKIQAMLPKVLPQPTQSYGSNVGAFEQEKMIVQKQLPSLPSGTPYGAAQFSAPKQ